MGFRSFVAGVCLLAGAASAQAQRPSQVSPEEQAAVKADLDAFTSERLTRFKSEEAFRRYLGAVLAAQRLGWRTTSVAPRVQFAAAPASDDAQTDAVQPICPDSDPQCFARQSALGQVVVTGSRITPSNPSITNNQMRNVEEGDIVKQIDRFLLILQDGRVFVVDTRAGRGVTRPRLALTDRMNVYRDAREDMWYDEMLVFGDRVLITGYSYRQEATELTVLRLDRSGRLTREAVFYLSSDDYYSSTNYATRLIGDKLVIYTPYWVSDMAQSSFRWPVVRRWLPDDDRAEARAQGRPLFDARQIYRPVRPYEDPVVHTVSVCALGAADEDGELDCRTTALVGPGETQWYVTETDAFLWTATFDHSPGVIDACNAPISFERDYPSALLYRVPVAGGSPVLVGTRGVPPDQFALHSAGGRFLALLQNPYRYCRDEPEGKASLAYFDIPLSSLSDTVRDVPRDRYAMLPGVGSYHVANRFTDRYLIYGSLGRSRRGLAEDNISPAFVVPVGAPEGVRRLDIGHSVIRAEQAGDDFVLTGYRDQEGLIVTLIDLDRQPRIASSVQLPQRFESEGRSHAFNSRIEPDGSGIMGLPTISEEVRSSREPWRSSASDLSFLEVDSRGRLRPIGELERRFDYLDDQDNEHGIPGYECEVSCIDWYGNSRPIFTDGRIFALTGTELIEGRVAGGRISEVQRINIALPAGR